MSAIEHIFSSLITGDMKTMKRNIIKTYEYYLLETTDLNLPLSSKENK